MDYAGPLKANCHCTPRARRATKFRGRCVARDIMLVISLLPSFMCQAFASLSSGRRAVTWNILRIRHVMNTRQTIDNAGNVFMSEAKNNRGPWSERHKYATCFGACPVPFMGFRPPRTHPVSLSNRKA